MAEALQEEHQVNGTSTHGTGNQLEDSTSYSTKQRRGSVDKDAQEMVISSLRSQIQDLISQVSQLNNKLVKSYDRVSDLEDDLHVASANVRTSSLKISQLELERTQHLSALNTGLLVEKTHVTAELNRLMEKATEEAAQRGQAESARLAIEKDLDDLSASLFGQANSMVAEARYDKHLSERKVEDAERALKSAEEAVQLMQVQMQAIQAEREEAEKKASEMEVIMGKGKWVKRHDGDSQVSLRLLSTHAPYQEYMSFLAHLRVLHPTSPNTPAMSTLLQLPFLSRLLTEDSEPTIRLDLAPSLNWLSRRTVLTAIHSGQLTIEPMSPTTLFAESSTHPVTTSIAGVNSSNDNITCALCGVSIFPTSDSSLTARPPVHPASHMAQNQATSWSGSFFKKSNSMGYSNGITQPSSPISVNYNHLNGSHLNSQIYIFRLASLPTSLTSLPIPSLAKTTSQASSPIPSTNISTSANGSTLHSHSGSQNNQPVTLYPLCMSGWCLQRLRTTCTLWAFVRTGIVDKVWEELPPPPPPSNIHVEKGVNGDKPPIPPRKRGIWGIASAIGERATSWSEGDREKAKRNSVASIVPATPEHRRMPPPLPPVSATQASAIPPPLPKRNEGRVRTATVTPPPSRINANVATTDTAQANDSTNTPHTSAELPPVPLYPNSTTRSELPETTSTAIHSHVHAAVNVPLPESRPTTPAAPSRTTSPANVTPVKGGIPPPIPRRAAARARVGGSRPGTPANANVETAVISGSPEKPTTVVSPSEEKEKEPESVKVENTNVDSDPEGVIKVESDQPITVTEEGAKENAENAEEETSDVIGPNRSSQPSPGSEEFVDAPTPGDEIQDPVADAISADKLANDEGDKSEVLGKQEDEEDTKTVVDTPIDLPSEKENDNGSPDVVVVNGHTESEAALLDDGVMEKVQQEQEQEPQQTPEEKMEEEKKRKEKEEWEKANYVGDTTWEERTWKEVNRLREDMFWARVGGIRE